MTKSLRVGQKVRWKWGQGTAEGKITERFESHVERTINGKTITRNATKEDPAFLVEQEDGSRALKTGSELEAG